MKIGFIYSGQGSQVPEMGMDFYKAYPKARAYYDHLNSHYPLIYNSFFGSEEDLAATENTQPCLMAFQTMITELLEKEGIEAFSTCGQSIGEIAAIHAAHSLTGEEAFDLAVARGQAMARASQHVNSHMLALLKVDLGDVKECCRKNSKPDKGAYVQVSNINGPDQVVISGDRDLVTDVYKDMIKKGPCKGVPLKVSGPYHTAYMKKAAEEMEDFLPKFDFLDLKAHLVSNVGGQLVKDSKDIPGILLKQVQSTVDFYQCLTYMIKSNDLLIEISPKKNITSMVRKIDRNKEIYCISDVKSFEKTLESLKERRA